MTAGLPLTPKLVIFDLDGVVYRGDAAVPGAASLVRGLRAAGRQVRFATNNSMATRDEYVTRLGAHGIPVAREEIVTSTSATIDHLLAHEPLVRRVLAVGTPGLAAELAGAGFAATSAAEAAAEPYDGRPLDGAYDAVVAGLDPDFDYRRLAVAAAAIRGGARFIATNADARYPTPVGFVPGAGALVAALQVAGGAEPLVIGKPGPTLFRTILERSGVPADEALAVGDNPDADVLAAHRAGLRSILVLTGVTDREAADALDGERRPDFVASGPAEVGALLGVSLG